MNQAAWISDPFERLTVGPAEYTEPKEDELVIKNYAVAMNPVDVIKQRTGDFLFSWIRYPFVLGEDVAGEVVGVGPGVKRFQVGDRVLAHAVGLEKMRNRAAEGAFQFYSVVRERMTAQIPESLSYADAAVLPLGISTAATALFEKNQLALEYPSLDPQPKNTTIVVWGASSSVGVNAVQLAAAAGYTVVATASEKNHAFVRSLGASAVFDYKHADTVKEIIALLADREFAGAVAIGPDSGDRCIEIARACCGRKFVSFVSFPVSFDGLPERPSRFAIMLHAGPQMLSANAAFFWKAKTGGVQTAYVWGSALMKTEVSELIYTQYLPAALAAGKYIAAPAAKIVGPGLDAIQPALDLLAQGVSATKLVVTL